MTPAEIQDAERRAVEARKFSIDCADEILVRLKFDRDDIRQFRDDLSQILELWKMKRLSRGPAASAPARISPFRLIAGGRPPAIHTSSE